MKLLPGRIMSSSGETEKKCSLLAKTFMDNISNQLYIEKLKRNLPQYITTAEKVRLRVGPSGIVVSDRTIWQNKLEKIAADLICDCHTDPESPKICYFITRTPTNRYMVLTFLCKTSDDSFKLVQSCPSGNLQGKPLSWYTSHNHYPHQLHNPVTQATHSSMIDRSSPGNRLQPLFARRFTSSVQQYDSDSSNPSRKGLLGTKLTANDIDNMAAARQGLTMVVTPTGSRNNTLHKISQSDQTKAYKERSQLQDQTNKQGGSKGSGLHLISSHSEMSRTGTGGSRQSKRKMGAYKSIAEYEQSQSTMSPQGGALRISSSGRENIRPTEPQRQIANLSNGAVAVYHNGPAKPNHEINASSLTLVMKGNEYSVQPSSSNRRNVTSKQRSPVSGVGNNQLVLQEGGFNPSLNIQTNTNQVSRQPQPKYDVKRQGKGENYLENERLIADDEHQYYRQHGQRIKQTDDGGHRLFLDKRLAHTNDIIGNQMVSGEHAQKVHTVESVGANHQSRIHSETKVSHTVSHPLSRFTPGGTQGNHTNAIQTPGVGKANARPVNVKTHQWPGIDSLLQSEQPMNLHFTQPNFQRFFQPQYEINTNPGFQRFFDSIQTYGPGFPQTPTERSSQLALKPYEGTLTNETKPAQIDSPSRADNESETSSIRSSASAYWPPELKFPSNQPETNNGWAFMRPNPSPQQAMLRRKTAVMDNRRPRLVL